MVVIFLLCLVHSSSALNTEGVSFDDIFNIDTRPYKQQPNRPLQCLKTT